jgi:hypothetical protein
VKTQRPSAKEPRPLASSLKFGETGATWGNLRVEAGSIPIDQRFFFEDDAARRVYQVTRVLPDPLDRGKRVLFYEAVSRDE